LFEKEARGRVNGEEGAGKTSHLVFGVDSANAAEGRQLGQETTFI
jgi:hypothetical protein